MDHAKLLQASLALGEGYLRRIRHEPSFDDPAQEAATLNLFGIPPLSSSTVASIALCEPFDVESVRSVQACAWVSQQCDRGDAHAAAGDSKQAKAAYDQALEMQPSDPRARTCRAELHAGLKQFGSAIDDLFQARKHAPAMSDQAASERLSRRLDRLAELIAAGTGVPVEPYRSVLAAAAAGGGGATASGISSGQTAGTRRARPGVAAAEGSSSEAGAAAPGKSPGDLRIGGDSSGAGQSPSPPVVQPLKKSRWDEMG